MKDPIDFDFASASKIEVNDGCVKNIWLEGSTQTYLGPDGSVMLETGRPAFIEFTNGRKMVITNSEWSSITLV